MLISWAHVTIMMPPTRLCRKLIGWAWNKHKIIYLTPVQSGLAFFKKELFFNITQCIGNRKKCIGYLTLF